MSELKHVKASELTPDIRNANRGTERGRYALEASMRQYGAGRSILVDKHGRIIAGNKTLETAADVGLDDVIIVQTDGTQVVAVQRMDLDLAHDDNARMLAYADNRVGQLDLDFDPEVLAADLAAGLDLSAFWQNLELDEIMAGPDGIAGEKDEPYSRKIEAPTYEPKGEKPPVSELFDNERTNQLVRDIDAADWLGDAEREFLTVAAQRHTVLNFAKIAEFYAHADAKTQRLMEDSALVIIDFDRAIELGYVQMTTKLAEIMGHDYPDE